MEEESGIILFLRKHWSKLLLGVLASACLVAWAERLSKSNEGQSKQDFLIMNQYFQKFQKGEHLSAESLESAETILDRHPELHSKYDSMLALTFLAESNGDKGAHYAKSLLKKVDADLPAFYKEYALTSFLVSEGKYSEALNASLALQERLQGEKGYQNLDAMNTLRLFFLADQLGNQAQKKTAWKKLESHPGYPAISSIFTEGKLTLADYVNSRS